MSDVNNFEVAQATEEQQRDPSHESHDQPKEEQTANAQEQTAHLSEAANGEEAPEAHSVAVVSSINSVEDSSVQSETAPAVRKTRIIGTATNGTEASYGKQKEGRFLAIKQRFKHEENGEWLPAGLYRRSLAGFFTTTILIIAVILSLTIVSETKSGFVTVSSPGDSWLKKEIWGRGLLWTALPTFLLILYRITLDWIVSGCSLRQPFIELAVGGPAKTTILLDYGKYSSYNAWLKAYRNGHYLVSACLLISLLLGFGITPLAAHLFTPGQYIFGHPTSFSLDTKFNDRGFTYDTSLKSVLDTAAALRLYGARPVPWTNNVYAFQAFSIPENPPSDNGGAINVSALTKAYSATLDCYPIPAIPNVTFDYQTIGPHSANLDLNAIDRDCALSETMVTGNNFTQYLQTFAMTQCGGQAHYSRLVLMSAQQFRDNPHWIQGVRFLSCIPAYWETEGTLTVTTSGPGDDGQGPIVKVFQATGEPKEFRPFFWLNYEQQLQELLATDPTAEISANGFSSLVLEYAQQLNDTSLFPFELLEKAVSDIWALTFALMAVKSLLQPSANGNVTTGTIFRSETRLETVLPVALITLVVLTLIPGIVVWIIFYVHVHEHRSILREKPAGPLSYAGILARSHLNRTALEIRDLEDFDGKVRKTAKKNGLLEGTEWKMDSQAGMREEKIILISQPTP